MDSLAKSLEKATKTATDNSEMMHDLLVGMENLVEIFKSMKEQMEGWNNPEVQMAEREYHETATEHLQEVFLSVLVSVAPVTMSTPIFPNPILTPSLLKASVPQSCEFNFTISPKHSRLRSG